MYGLHQAPRAWYETLSTYMLDNGFERWKIDKTLFIRRHKGDILLVQVFVDDIMFVVCACARYQVNPKVSHLLAVKRIFRYLKGHPKLVLWYPKDSPFDLVVYTDSDYAGVSLDRKSTTGDCQFLGCRLISWQCKKQIVVANSRIEVEYVAVSSCCG
ncbi:putative ribonuclease H-like domain-containing protein [Tanacetum coccineum]